MTLVFIESSYLEYQGLERSKMWNTTRSRH